MTIATAEIIIAVLAIAAIGVGLWMYEPWTALVGVGVLVLSLTVLGRLRRA